MLLFLNYTTFLVSENVFIYLNYFFLLPQVFAFLKKFKIAKKYGKHKISEEWIWHSNVSVVFQYEFVFMNTIISNIYAIVK